MGSGVRDADGRCRICLVSPSDRFGKRRVGSCPDAVMPAARRRVVIERARQHPPQERSQQIGEQHISPMEASQFAGQVPPQPLLPPATVRQPEHDGVLHAPVVA
jgi:hypothetical protein